MRRSFAKVSAALAACVMVGATSSVVLTAALVTGPLAKAAAAAPTCNETVDQTGMHGPYTTIQAAIDAASTGDTICVWPGMYNQDQANGRLTTGPGGGINDFNIFVGTSVTIEGLDASGNLITSAPEGLPSTAAPVIEANRPLEPDFGSSNIFVQAPNVTLRGLEINGDPNDIAKSLEITANNVTVTDVAFTPSTAYSGAGDLAPGTLHGGTGIYISDFNFAANTSTVQSYTFTNNTFDGGTKGAGIYIANGAGWTGPASGRVISGNTFSSTDDAIDFAGPTPNIAWLLNPVGAATITGNTFSNTTSRQVVAWGTGGPGVGYISPDWCGIMSSNTFDAGSFIWQGSAVCPSGNARTWTSLGGSGGGDYTDIAGLYSTIQQYGINESQAGDTVQVLPGTYDEPLTIDHALTLLGANAGTAGTATRGPESLVERLAADTGPDFNITTSAPVTINGFHAQFNATDNNDQTGGVLLSVGSANNLTFENNIVDDSNYANALIFDDNAATSTFQNNLFTNLHQFDLPNEGTGVIAAWGFTGPGTPLAAVTFTGNTFSHLTDTDGMPAINLNTVTGTVTGNTFEDIHQYGILLAGTLANLSIANNLFDSIHNDTPMSSPNRGSGIRTFETPNFTGLVSITQNTFSNDYHGVRVANDGSPADLTSGDLVVNRNAFTTDTSDGISVDPATIGTLDGSCNWWGSASGPSDAGPGTGTGVTTDVAFTPWLSAAAPLATAPCNVPGVPGAPVIGVAVADGVGSAVVSFSPPGSDGGSAISGYTATCFSLDGEPSMSAAGMGSPITVAGLVAGTPYECSVTASNMIGTGPPSGLSDVFGLPSATRCTTVPSAPLTLSNAPGNGSAVVSWAPPLTGASCLAGYVVTPYLGSVAQLSVLIPGFGTTTVVSGLTNGVTYTFTVTAENGLVEGPPSVMSVSVTVGAPAAVTAARAVRVGRGVLRVAFGVPKSNGSPITKYTATCSSRNGGVTKTTSAKAGPLTVTGLSAGKTYTCTVKATNARGTGPPSHPTTAIKA
ncbi:MAG: fibronectin type III domain-containing protein [Acidimicrobiia bacterium]